MPGIHPIGGKEDPEYNHSRSFPAYPPKYPSSYTAFLSRPPRPFPAPSDCPPNDCRHHKQRCCTGCPRRRNFFSSSRAWNRLCLILHSASPDQKPMAVDPIWGTCYQRAVVFSFDPFQRLCLVRLHYQDLINLIGKSFIQYLQHEQIPLLQLIQIRKESGRRKPPMG